MLRFWTAVMWLFGTVESESYSIKLILLSLSFLLLFADFFSFHSAELC